MYRRPRPWMPDWYGSAWTIAALSWEIVALDLEDAVVVIHVMPTRLRR